MNKNVLVEGVRKLTLETVCRVGKINGCEIVLMKCELPIFGVNCKGVKKRNINITDMPSTSRRIINKQGRAKFG